MNDKFLLLVATETTEFLDKTMRTVFGNTTYFLVAIATSLAVLVLSVMTLVPVLRSYSWEAATASAVAVNDGAGINAETTVVLISAILFSVCC